MKDECFDSLVRGARLCCLGSILLTALLWLLLSVSRPVLGGLFLGQLGGFYVIWSLQVQGRQPSTRPATTVFAFSMVAMVTRFLALAVVLVAAELFRAWFNPFAALAGFLLGFIYFCAAFLFGTRRPG